SEVRRLLRECLERDPNRRLRDIGDTWRLLDEPPQAAAGPRQRKLPWAAAPVLVLLGMLAAWGWLRNPRPSDKPLVRLDVDLGPDVSLASPGGGANAILSPDG